MINVTAPAKINLTLEVLGKRPDGYHNIRSVIQMINLGDTLHFQESQQTEFSCDLPEWQAEKSLVSRAVELVQGLYGGTKGVTVRIEKRIPLVSGLGGDSSDAVATLKGLNKLWQLGLSAEKLYKLAAQLGSDVPFFINGGTALMEGRGDLITPLPPLPKTWLVLIIPEVTRILNKTAQLYASLKPSHFTDGLITDHLISEMKAGENLKPELLFNTFENVAFERSGELSLYSRHILKTGAANIHLAGSGPAMFTMVKNEAEGKELIERLKGQRMELVLARTLNSLEGDSR